LLAILLSLLVVTLLTTGLATRALLREYLTDQVDADLRSGAPDAAFFALRAMANSFDAERRVPGGYVVQVTSDQDDPAVFGLDEDDPLAPAFPTMTAQEVQKRPREPFAVPSRSGRLQWRAIALTLVDRETGTPWTALVAAPLAGVERTLNKLTALVLSLGAVVILACAGLGWLAIRRSFVPLREVEDTAAAIAAGDLSRRVRERPRTTEVGRLTASLNGMLAQIEQAFRYREASEARTRRFAADASHELRTPLASIRGFAELHRQGAVPPDEVPRTMRRIEDEATRMGGLVEDLLLLARLDEQRPGRSEPVDLAVLANDAVHDARGLDPTRRVRLVGLNGSGGPTPAVVIGDEDRLRQVVANLMANAVRHTPAGTAIEVAVGSDAKPHPPGTERRDARANTLRAVLEVRDHGPGLTPEQAERVFERFYRVDTSRSRGKGGGSGLGLSIVAAVVAAHRGTVGTRTTPGGGATFRVEIPATPPE
jgi:two-component system OmpR family sensor kinase